MAHKERVKRTTDEILENAARLVAGTINPEAMGIAVEEVDVENFVKYFKEAATQLLYRKETLLVAIGRYAHTDNSGIYSIDMNYILNHIERNMHTKFYFFHGISLWFSKEDIIAHWLPQ